MRRATHTSASVVGAGLVLGSAVLFSLSGILTKSIDAGSWTILTWRGLIGGLSIGCYVALRRRGETLRATFRLDAAAWVTSVVGAVGSIAFIVSFKHTLVANVSVIYATIPFIAAALERLIIGTPIKRSTLRYAALSLLGVVIIVTGSLGSPNLAGDATALAMVVLNALYMVLIRAFPDTDAVLTGAVGSMLLFGVGVAATQPLDVERRDVWLLIAFGMVFALASVLWIEGTMRIPAAESGLLGSAETPAAIGLAWVLLGEVPPAASAVGAIVVLGTVLLHTTRDVRRAHPSSTLPVDISFDNP